MKKLFLSFLLTAFLSLVVAGTASASWIWVGSDDMARRIIPGSHQEILFNAVAKYVNEHFEEISDRTVK